MAIDFNGTFKSQQTPKKHVEKRVFKNPYAEVAQHYEAFVQEQVVNVDEMLSMSDTEREAHNKQFLPNL